MEEENKIEDNIIIEEIEYTEELYQKNIRKKRRRSANERKIIELRKWAICKECKRKSKYSELL